MRVWILEGIILTVLTVATVSCTPATKAPAPSTDSTVAQPTGPTASPPTDASSPMPFVRSCDTSVFGDLGRGWREGAVLAGPLAFVGARGYADAPARTLEGRGDRWSGQKVLVRVTGGAVVTVEIAREARAFAGLLYDPSHFNTNVPERAVAAVRFEPCPAQSATQFNGAFLVDGVRCVPVTVTVEGMQPQDRVLEFGHCTA
jgi:hypothetical protein